MRYYDWLINNVQKDDNVNRYSKLLLHLFSREFQPIIRNDDNRGIDGLAMRNRFFEEMQDDDPLHFRRGCSILEMLIALTIRIDKDVIGDELDEYISLWFWSILIKNLGLLEFDNEHYDEEKINYILDMFENRQYMPNGDGGLFPLRNPLEDQRNVEIWFQLQNYLMENNIL